MGLTAFTGIMFICMLSMPFWTTASDVRSDQSVTIATGETVNEDLYIAAGEFKLEGTANGDVYAAAGRTVVPGNISGALTVTGGDIDIAGSVGRSARVVGGTVVISGTIDGDLLIVGGSITLEGNALVEGNLRVLGGQLDQRGVIKGDLSGSVTDLDLNGEIGGDVDIDVQSLDVARTADIGGTVNYVSPRDGNIATGAAIDGNIDHQRLSPWGADSGFRGRFFSPLLRTLWMLTAGVLIIALAPRLVATISGNVRRPWKAALAGIVSLALVPILALMLMVTVVGIPIGLILLTLFVMALYLSQMVIGQRIGMLLLPRSWNDGSRGYLLLAMTIGVIILGAVRFIPLPYVSSVVNLLVAITGLGATALLVRQLRPGYRSGSAV